MISSVGDSQTIGEENLNIALAELLAERGLKALGEVVLRAGRKRREPDVLIELNGVRIIIEGKRPGAWDSLVRQCEKRIDEGLCDLCVMVEYTDVKVCKLMPTQLDIKDALLKGRFNVGFLSYVDKINVNRMEGGSQVERYEGVDFSELLTHILTAYERVVKESTLDEVIEEMRNTLNRFAEDVVGSVNIERLKEVLELREKEGGENG